MAKSASPPTNPNTDATFTIAPRLANNCGKQALLITNWLVRFMSRVVCQPSRVHSPTGPSPKRRPLPPAALHKPSICGIAVMAASTACASVRSMGMVVAAMPNVARPAASRSTAIIWAPSACNRSAVARPMPLAAPVTTIVFCKNRCIDYFLMKNHTQNRRGGMPRRFCSTYLRRGLGRWLRSRPERRRLGP